MQGQPLHFGSNQPFSYLRFCNNVSKKEHEVWHFCLGHPSYVRLNVLKNLLHFKKTY